MSSAAIMKLNPTFCGEEESKRQNEYHDKTVELNEHIPLVKLLDGCYSEEVIQHYIMLSRTFPLLALRGP